jgi:hypothetical protein
MNNSDGVAITISDAFGHLSPSGQPISAQHKNAGAFVTTANLNGHGQMWNLKVVSHPTPNK